MSDYYNLEVALTSEIVRIGALTMRSSLGRNRDADHFIIDPFLGSFLFGHSEFSLENEVFCRFFMQEK